MPRRKKSPGDRPGLFRKLKPAAIRRPAVEFRGAGLDRLGGLAGDLLRQLGELLGLGGEGLELLRRGGQQFEGFGRRLHAEQFLGEIERGRWCWPS